MPRSETSSVGNSNRPGDAKLRVGVAFGGRSGEHEVSVRSARAVIAALDSAKYEVVPLAITKAGRWLAPAAGKSLIGVDRVTESLPASVSDSGDAVRGLARMDQASDASERLDVVFPVLHGTFGEDGTIQGLLEMADIPYIGCGVLASAGGMDKIAMKTLFRDAGLPVCRYMWFLRRDWERDRAGTIRRISDDLGFPVFVKPANLGSSVGISRAADTEELARAIDSAARYDRKIIVEEGLDVREIECAVLGNDDAIASLPGEYVVRDERARFLDYTEKYAATGHVEFVVPADVPEELRERIRRMAIESFRAIDGAGLARVDFFLRRDTGELLVNELNTMPGFTPVSGYPKMWAASGLDFAGLVDRLIELALERHADKSRNLTDL